MQVFDPLHKLLRCENRSDIFLKKLLLCYLEIVLVLFLCDLLLKLLVKHDVIDSGSLAALPTSRVRVRLGKLLLLLLLLLRKGFVHSLLDLWLEQEVELQLSKQD